MAIKYNSIPTLSEKDIKRFWSRVNIPENINNCWEWIGFITPSSKYKNTNKLIVRGYGTICIRRKEKQYNLAAHRLSYFLYNKIDPLENLVCHTCDNRKCVNPNHLFLATHEQKMKDMTNKNRSAIGVRNARSVYPETTAKGEKNGNSRFTEKQIKEIRELKLNQNLSNRALGKMFNTNHTQIKRIITREIWKHI